MNAVDYGDRVECPGCGALSACVYRCDSCGHDFASDSAPTARMEDVQ